MENTCIPFQDSAKYPKISLYLFIFFFSFKYFGLVEKGKRKHDNEANKYGKSKRAKIFPHFLAHVKI